jgi:hypothetical protein
MTLIFLVCSLRVNICFVVIFFSLLLALVFLTVTYWLLAADMVGNAAVAGKMLVVSYANAVNRWNRRADICYYCFRLPEHAPSSHALPGGGYFSPS